MDPRRTAGNERDDARSDTARPPGAPAALDMLAPMPGRTSSPPDRVSGAPLRAAVLAALVVAGAAADASAQAGEPASGDRLVRASLVCETEALVAGAPATLGLRLQVERGWHIYGQARNDSGYPPELQLTLPPGLRAGQIEWPVPERHILPGPILDHVYFGDVTLPLSVEVSADLPAGEVTLTGRVEWLVCDELCLMGAGEVSLTLPLRAAGATADAGPGAPLIAAARARLPGAAPADLAVDFSNERVTLGVPGATGLVFIPDPKCLPLADLVTDGRASGQTLDLRRASRGPGGSRLAGVLVVQRAAGAAPTFHRIDAAPPEAPP